MKTVEEIMTMPVGLEAAKALAVWIYAEPDRYKSPEGIRLILSPAGQYITDMPPLEHEDFQAFVKECEAQYGKIEFGRRVARENLEAGTIEWLVPEDSIHPKVRQAIKEHFAATLKEKENVK